MGRIGNTRIWQRRHITIEASGNYVKLAAPCGEFRRVTAKTARQIASDLILAAGEIEGAHALEQRIDAAIEKAAPVWREMAAQSPAAQSPVDGE